MALLAVVVQAGSSYSKEDQSGNRLVAEYAAATLARFPPDALVISKGDLYWNTLRYMQQCEGKRPDLKILDVEVLKSPWADSLARETLGDVVLPGRVYRAASRAQPGSYDLGRLIDANIARFTILSNALDHDGDRSWAQRHTAWPDGVYDQLFGQGQSVDTGQIADRAERWNAEVRLTRPAQIRRGSWEEIAWNEYLNAQTRPGSQLLNHAINRGPALALVRRAGRILAEAAASDERFSASVYLNLGIYYFLIRDEHPGAVDAMVAAWQRYLAIAPADDPQRALVDQVLRDPKNAELDIGGRP